MKRNILLAILAFCFFSASSIYANEIFPIQQTVNVLAACPSSPSHTAPDFCSGFAAAVACPCLAKHITRSTCNNPRSVYKLMKAQYARYGAQWLAKACSSNENPGTSTKECEDQWDCYMTGQPYFSSDGACYGKAGKGTPC